HGTAGHRPAANPAARTGTLHRSSSSGPRADRHCHFLWYDGAGRCSGAASLSRKRQRPCGWRGGRRRKPRMNHWILVPIILPSLAAPLIVLAARQDIVLQRCFSISSTAGMLAVSLFLLGQAISGPPQLYELSDWPSPFGIVMVLDRLSAMMVTLTALLALLVLLYAIQAWDTRGRHFHALYQFQLMGLAGAFLTGDLFNLFV